jgi:4a-hydroxytetrahydrobiopterin dehydratase
MPVSELASLECVACKGGTPPLKGEALRSWGARLGNGWKVLDEHQLEKDFRFPNFRSALNFVNHVGELAETVNHHPDLSLSWGKAHITLWTHKIGGLSETDFVFAAKSDQLYEGPPSAP